MPKRITIAHSPDSDDAFMFYALATEKITSDKYQFQVIREDIETLNHLAQKEKYDITALSFHAYAYVADKYVLTSSGASFAEKDYGPIVVSRSPRPLGERGDTPVIAIPGTLTTAALLLKMIQPDIQCVAMPFDQIIPAVISGRGTASCAQLDAGAARRAPTETKIDAGLLIHEGQLQYEKFGLKKILSLTEHWKQLSSLLNFDTSTLRHFDTSTLPLPLGGTAIRRSLGEPVIQELSIFVQNSIRHALNHPNEARDYAMQFKRDLNEQEADRYLSWYANQRTLDMGEDGKNAVQILLDCALEKGLISQPIKATFV